MASSAVTRPSLARLAGVRLPLRQARAAPQGGGAIRRFVCATAAGLPAPSSALPPHPAHTLHQHHGWQWLLDAEDTAKVRF